MSRRVFDRTSKTRPCFKRASSSRRARLDTNARLPGRRGLKLVTAPFQPMTSKTPRELATMLHFPAGKSRPQRRADLTRIKTDFLYDTPEGDWTSTRVLDFPTGKSRSLQCRGDLLEDLLTTRRENNAERRVSEPPKLRPLEVLDFPAGKSRPQRYRYESREGFVGTDRQNRANRQGTGVCPFNSGASNAKSYAASPLLTSRSDFPAGKSSLFRNPSGAQKRGIEVFRCFHCDQLLHFDYDRGLVHPAGGDIAMRCPDCGWADAPHPEPLRCPDCGGLRMRNRSPSLAVDPAARRRRPRHHAGSPHSTSGETATCLKPRSSAHGSSLSVSQTQSGKRFRIGLGSAACRCRDTHERSRWVASREPAPNASNSKPSISWRASATTSTNLPGPPTLTAGSRSRAASTKCWPSYSRP